MLLDSGVLRNRPRSSYLPDVRSSLGLLIVISMGAVLAVANRFYINPDGVSYLDLSDLYARGEYSAAVNGYWSPLYPWLLAPLRLLFPNDLQGELTRVHALNFLIYLASFATFSVMMHELRSVQRARAATGNRHVLSFESWQERLSALAIFLWAAHQLISITIVSPDMCVAAEIYLIAALMLRAIRGPTGLVHSATLGAVAGIAYLTKAAMFPFALVVIAVTGRGTFGRWSVNQRLTCLMVFLVVASPQLIALSNKMNRLTFGENGRIAYATYVNKYPVFWTGYPPGSGKPVHPIVKLPTTPEALVYPNPKSSFAYPFWGDPAYWDQGIEAQFNLGQQISATWKQLSYYASFLGFPALAILALAFMAGRKPDRTTWWICAPPVALLVLYGLVYVEPRYVGASLVVLILCLAASFEFSSEGAGVRSARAVLSALAITLGLGLASSFQGNLRAILRKSAHDDNWTIAKTAGNLGLRPKERVASVGSSFDSYWARLAQVQIGMEISEHGAARFWELSEADRTQLQDSFRALGADAIIATSVDSTRVPPGWRPLGARSSYMLRLSPDGHR